MKGIFDSFARRRKGLLASAGLGLSLMMPGLFFVLVGVAALLAPQLLIVVLAAVFLFVGVFLCLIGLKVSQLKRRFEELGRRLQASVLIQQVNINELEEEEGDEVTYH